MLLEVLHHMKQQGGDENLMLGTQPDRLIVTEQASEASGLAPLFSIVSTDFPEHSGFARCAAAQICHKILGAQKEPRKSLILVGRIGFEPMTNWLKANCSTS